MIGQPRPVARTTYPEGHTDARVLTVPLRAPVYVSATN